MSKSNDRKHFKLYNKKPKTKLSKDIYKYGADNYNSGSSTKAESKHIKSKSSNTIKYLPEHPRPHVLSKNQFISPISV